MLILLTLTGVGSLYIATIIHESGHLVMGLLTGYEFVSFRIGSLTILKEDGKFKRRKFNIAGTGGQCLLTYKWVENPDNIPYFWYHFGGVFFNFLTVLLCMPMLLFERNVYVTVFFMMLAIVALVTGIMNILPIKAMGIGTDGYNLIQLKKSPVNRIALYKTLVINGLQFKGVRLENMEADILTFSEDEKACLFGSALRVIEANLLLNQHDFKAAGERYRSIIEADNAIALYQNESRCELLFCMIMTGASHEEINNLLDDKLSQYIKETGKLYVMRKRLMYAYYLIVQKDEQKALEEYNLAQKMENTYPAKGEYLSEMALIGYIKTIRCDRG